ncbi:MAG: M67 family metallopeptidase [Thermodesulfovibrionia bacterium]|nr:M67 family metallopeptidase [Thermodesulfovibrionia bacterium]
MKINKDIIDRIYKHAVESYPDECCGIITGKDDLQILHRCSNIQNELHADDPEGNPRDARTAYAIDRAEAGKIYSEAKENSRDVIAFYHSHIDCDAYFSETDKEAQVVFGEPEFPDAIQIVVSVIKKNICGLKSFKWDSDKKDFVVSQI